MKRTPHALDFGSARAAFIAGTDDPRAYLERCIETIVARNPEVRAFITLGVESARRAADASGERYRNGAPLSAVDGMPLGVKDIMDTFDMPTQMGSPVYAGWQPSWDAACVHAMRAGGAIIVGKTVTTAFASGETNEARNPLDLTRTPGGSSSGSAAAVGAGMVPAALGTQTQGSTLRPASYCGAVGFKATHGALTMQGVHPISLTHDHLGVIAGTLADTWSVASHIAVASGSPGSAGLNGASATLPAARIPRKLLVMHMPAWDSEVDADTRAAFDTLLTWLREHDVDLLTRHHHADLAALEDDFFGAFIDRSVAITSYEMKWPYEQYIARHGELVEKRNRQRIAQAREITPAYYVELIDEKARMKERVRVVMGGCDAIITLTASGPAPVGHGHTGNRSYQLFASFLGLPAFSLPIMSSGGLPVGAQLIGHAGRDGELCALAHGLMTLHKS